MIYTSKRHLEILGSETSISIYIFQNKVFGHMACALNARQNQKSPGKVLVIFSDIVFGDETREEHTGFQILESGAPNSSMALSYEHYSVEPTSSPRSLGV